MNAAEERWKNLPSPVQLQTPLNVALMVSPIFLLGNRLLPQVNVGKPLLLAVSKAGS
jgi:hypothetical protein